jgi:hypothetical protein
MDNNACLEKSLTKPFARTLLRERFVTLAPTASARHAMGVLDSLVCHSDNSVSAQSHLHSSRLLAQGIMQHLDL